MNRIDFAQIRGCPTTLEGRRCFISVNPVQSGTRSFIEDQMREIEKNTEDREKYLQVIREKFLSETSVSKDNPRNTDVLSVYTKFNQEFNNNSCYLVLEGFVLIEYSDGSSSRVNSINFNDWIDYVDTNFIRNRKVRVSGCKETLLLRINSIDFESFADTFNVRVKKFESTTYNHTFESDSSVFIFSNYPFQLNGQLIEKNSVVLESIDNTHFELSTSNICYVVSVTKK